MAPGALALFHKFSNANPFLKQPKLEHVDTFGNPDSKDESRKVNELKPALQGISEASRKTLESLKRQSTKSDKAQHVHQAVQRAPSPSQLDSSDH